MIAVFSSEQQHPWVMGIHLWLQAKVLHEPVSSLIGDSGRLSHIPDLPLVLVAIPEPQRVFNRGPPASAPLDGRDGAAHEPTG